MASLSTPILYREELPPQRRSLQERQALANETELVFEGRFGRARLANTSERISKEELAESFSHFCLDHRYYPIVEETLPQNFSYRYLVLEDREGRVRGVQPLFVVHQDLTAGVPAPIRSLIEKTRVLLPGFLKLNTLMVGCSAGEGELGGRRSEDQRWLAEALHEVLPQAAAACGAAIIVLKDFPARYRESLGVFHRNGYERLPSLPAVALNLDFPDFEEYMKTRLSKKTRKNLRHKFKKSEAGAGDKAQIEMTVQSDVSDIVDELYPLYLAVHNRSQFRFEKLTREYFREVGRQMPDRARFFVWRRAGRIVAFSLCFIHGEVIYDCVMGLDYSIALDLHLYFVTWRDIISWSLKNGIGRYYSGPLNYEPKLHFRCELAPLDLYVTHTNRWINPIFRRIVSFLEPARHQPIIRRFPNASEL